MLPQQSRAAAFVFTTIDFPGAACTQAFGINDTGQVVGLYNTLNVFCGGQPDHGFLLDMGTFTTIDLPGATVTQPLGINNPGLITGFCEGDGCGIGDSFLRDSGGNFTTFGFPSSCSTIAYSIDNSGQIVGSYTNSCSGSNQSFQLAGGNFTPIAIPGSQSDEALGLNNAGDIVGTYGTANPFVENHGYLLSAGSLTTIDAPGATVTRAQGINDPPSKTIVGVYADGGGVSHGYMLAGGNFTTIDVPGAISTAPYKINNNGQIVGSYQDSTGRFHGFLATPLPCGGSCGIASNFNGTPIPGGDFIWFNSNFQVSDGLGSTPGTVQFTGGTIQFTANNQNYQVNVPNSTITFSPTFTCASTSFSGGSWQVKVPISGNDEVFLSGLAYQVPAGGFPGGIKNVTWSGTFNTDRPGLKMQWKWAAAVYSRFPDAAAPAAKPTHSSACAYPNSDHAGTPESDKSFVIGGASGGGGSNWTGSWSGTSSVPLTCQQ